MFILYSGMYSLNWSDSITFSTLHYTTLLCTALHCTILHYVTLTCTVHLQLHVYPLAFTFTFTWNCIELPCIRIYIHTVYVFTYILIYIYVHIYSYVYMYIYIHTYIYIYICIYIYMYVCMYVYIYIYTYIYINIYIYNIRKYVGSIHIKSPSVHFARPPWTDWCPGCSAAPAAIDLAMVVMNFTARNDFNEINKWFNNWQLQSWFQMISLRKNCQLIPSP